MSLDATIWAWRCRNLRPAQKLVLLSLADRAGEGHTCHPTIKRLCFDTELDRKTVIDALQKLEGSGLIRKTGRMTGYNNCVPEYALVGVCGREDGSPESAASACAGQQSQKRNSSENGPVPKTDSHQSQKRDRHQSQKRDTESPIITPHKNPPIQERGGGGVLMHDQPLEFAELRALYDEHVRHEAPGAGLAEYWQLHKAHAWPGIDRLMQGWDAWLACNQWQKSGGRYRPGLARFLSERMWLATSEVIAAAGAGLAGASGGKEDLPQLPLLDDVRRYLTRYGADGVREYCSLKELDAEAYLAALGVVGGSKPLEGRA